MGRTWVLHTETKGTGAQVVPLESVTKRPSGAAPTFVRKPRRAATADPPSPPPSHEFKVVDLMTRETLAERAGTREAVKVLKGVRSPVDVNVYVWREEPSRWRLLTFAEKRALWDLRDG